MPKVETRRPSGGLRFRILLPFLAGLVVLLSTFALSVTWLQEGELEVSRSRSLGAARDLMATHLNRDSDMMHAVLRVMEGQDTLLSALEREDRDGLLRALSDRFSVLREEHGLTHLYFVRPDRTTLVRVHRPDLHDDLIDRRTMLRAEETQQPVAGLEIGRFRGQMTLRVIHPWHHGDKLLGYVELGKEVGLMLEDMASTLDLDLFVVLDKKFVERSYWEDGMRALGRVPDWNELATGLIVHQTLPDTPPEVMRHWNESEQGLKRVMVEGRYLHGGSLPIADVKGGELGRLIVLRDATLLVERARASLLTASGIAVLVGLVLFLALVPFLGRVEGQIRSDFARLRDTQASLQAARDEALAASRAKSDFLASMSHEIRTPMNGVVGMAELLISTELNEEQLGYAGTVKSSAEALVAVINDILDFSKVEAGRLEITQTEFDPILLLEEIGRLLSHSAKLKDLEFEIRIDVKTEYLAMGDPGRIRQVLMNLVGNAIKFTERGRVTTVLEAICSAKGEQELVFTVTDTGIGIPADKLAGVFERFTQIDGSSTRQFGGTGLGLAISKQLAELMGGTLEAVSEYGHGSTFTMRLTSPLGAKRADQGAAPLKSGADTNALSPLPFTARVLVVEDNRVNQRVAERMLRAMGCETALASNGREAVEALKRQPFDLVLMDSQMPVLDGVEATREIRQLDNAMREVAIVGLTGNALAADRERAMEAGMDDYHLKPIAAATLRAALTQWVQQPQQYGSAETRAHPS